MIYRSDRLRWNEVLGDPYTKALTPIMMLEGGQTVAKITRTIDSTEKRAYEITYDLDYVYSWIAKKLLKALQIKSKEEAIALMAASWDYYERSWSVQNDID